MVEPFRFKFGAIPRSLGTKG